MADNCEFGHPDSNPREWGNSPGKSVGKQPGNMNAPRPTDIIEHKLQHSDYSALAGGDVKESKRP